MNPTVFLDRDGTIIEDKGFLSKKEEIMFLPNSIGGLKMLASLGLKLVIITTQSGIARGYFTEEDLHKLNEHLLAELKKHGIEIDRIYYCPHHPVHGKGKYKKKCRCRKPDTGMIEQAQQELDIDLAKSYLIGDKSIDIQMGMNAGVKTILVKTGYAGKEEGFTEVEPDYVVEDLLEAAKIVKEKV
ncbi:MAG: HAD family hydrolase [Nanoarchaeota archaeon]|nr:HAD family hydrolase [Nanoarchaeota archaeon]